MPALRSVDGLMASVWSAGVVTVVPTSNRISTRVFGPKPGGVNALTGLFFVALPTLKPGK